MAIFIGWLDELAQSSQSDANQRSRIFAAKLGISLTNIWTHVTLFSIVPCHELVSSRTYLPHCLAVQQAREAARRTQCKNNLKQIGLALHNYESTFTLLPPGFMARNFASTHTQILPYIEQGNVTALFNFNVDTNVHIDNQAARQQKLAMFACPSQPSSPALVLTGTQCPNGCGTTNYVQSFGDNANYASQRGPFGRNKGAKFRDFVDGLTNTGLFAEIILGPSTGSGNTSGVVAAGSNQDFWVATNLH